MLKSINLPQGMLQANMVERIQQTQQQNPDMQQRYFEIALAKEKKRAEETVANPRKAEQLSIGREDRSKERERSFDDAAEREAAVDDDSNSGLPEEETGNVIDVKV